MMNEKICPTCGKNILVYEGYPIWCDNCDWGIWGENNKEEDVSFFQGQIRKLNSRFGEKLLREVISHQVVKPKLTFSIVLANIIAVFTYLLALVFLALGAITIYLLWKMGTSICAGILGYSIGVGFLALAWLARPRIGKLPKEYVSSKQSPILHEVVRKIGVALDTKPIDYVIVDPAFNAGFTQVGVARKRILILGLPLLLTLQRQEVVALIGHELAHSENGDPNRTFWILNAINTLISWSNAIDPSHKETIGRHELIAYYWNSFLSLLPRLLALALNNLTYHSMQRAEYLADYLGAKISGTEAMISMLRKLELYRVYHTIILRTKATYGKDKGNLFETLRNYMISMPEREMDHFARVQRRTQSGIDTTHPPTEYRIKFLQSKFIQTPKLQLSQGEYDRLMDELRSFEVPIQKKILGI